MRRCGLAGRINVGLMLLAAAGTVFGLAVSGMAEETIKIGAYLPMTGAVAGYGQQEWAGIQIANEMQPTVLGKKIELVLTDTKSDKIEAANAMSRLIEKDKVIGCPG